MRIWLASFAVLFVIAELYQWAKHLTLPLPVYILGGALLAFASNHDKILRLFTTSTEPVPPLLDAVSVPDYEQLAKPLPTDSISFTIQRSNELK